MMFLLLVNLVLMGTPAGLAAQAEPEESQQRSAPSTPSLVDLARKQKEQRSEGSGEVRVIRNEDLLSLTSARVSTGRTPARKVPDEDEVEVLKDETDSTDDGVDLAFWAAAFKEARNAFETALNQRMVLELRLNNLRNAFFQNSDGTTRERIEAEMAQTVEQISQARENEKTARQIITDLETRARSAGLTPGQIRDLVGELPDSNSFMEGIPGIVGQDS